MSFNQQMSFPRELTLRLVPEGYRIFREPVREISQLYQRTVQLAARPLIPGENGFAEVPAGKLLDLEFTLAVNGVREVNITLGGEPVRFDPRTSRLTAFGRTMPWPIADGLLRIRALLDRTSLELFGNDGELTHSGVFFHDPATATNSLSVEGGPARLERLVFHELESIWE
jgi:sucrose-6-phosphate hydrolase SacC (GH32 family)